MKDAHGYKPSRPLGLGLNYDSVLQSEKYAPELVPKVPLPGPAGTSAQNEPKYSLGITPDSCPIRVEPWVFAIEFDKQVQDLIINLAKDDKQQKEATRKAIEDVVTKVWSDRVKIEKAMALSLRQTFFNYSVEVITATPTTAAPDKTTVVVKNVFAEAAENKSIAPIAQKVAGDGFAALVKAVKDVADPHLQRQMRRLMTYSNLGSWIHTNRWVLFGAVVVVSGLGMVYFIVDNTIGAENAVNIFLKNKDLNLDSISGALLGKADVKDLGTGEANLKVGLKNVVFQESVREWKIGAFASTDYRMSPELTGKHVFNLYVDHKGNVTSGAEFALAYKWDSLSASLNAKALESGYSLGVGLEYSFKNGFGLYLQREWKETNGKAGQQTVFGLSFKIPEK